MKSTQKLGGLAALYLAAAYLATIVLFLLVFDYMSITNALQKVELLAAQTGLFILSNLWAYVLFGIALIVLVLSLYDRMKNETPNLARVTAVIGFLWAAALIASGLIANAAVPAVLAIYPSDPSQAALTWSTLEVVSNGLGGASGEILGGLMTLLVSVAGLKSARLPKALNLLGLLVGGIGIATTIPALTAYTGIFGISQMAWFVWLGIVLLRKNN